MDFKLSSNSVQLLEYPIMGGKVTVHVKLIINSRLTRHADPLSYR